jgi:hypothetical protein
MGFTKGTLEQSGLSYSFVEQTRVLSLVGEEVEETEIPGAVPVHLLSFLLEISVADPGPGSGAFLTPGSGIRDG